MKPTTVVQELSITPELMPFVELNELLKYHCVKDKLMRRGIHYNDAEGIPYKPFTITVNQYSPNSAMLIITQCMVLLGKVKGTGQKIKVLHSHGPDQFSHFEFRVFNTGKCRGKNREFKQYHQ